MGVIDWQPKDLYWQANHGDYELFANDGAYKTTHKGAIISDGTECEHLSHAKYKAEMTYREHEKKCERLSKQSS